MSENANEVIAPGKVKQGPSARRGGRLVPAAALDKLGFEPVEWPVALPVRYSTR